MNELKAMKSIVLVQRGMPKSSGIAALVFLAVLTVAQGGSTVRMTAFERELRQGVNAFRHGSGHWSADSLRNAATSFRRATAREPDNPTAHYWLGATLFHLLLHEAGAAESDRGTKSIERLAERAVEALERALELNPEDSESHVLLATLLGMRVAEHPFTAVWRGPRIVHHRNRALELEPENPRAHYLAGTCYFHAPDMVGGVKKGLKHFLKAEQLYEREARSEPGDFQPQWGYSHCLAFIGRSYQALGESDNARAYFRKALARNPHNRLAREELAALQKPEGAGVQR